MTPVLGVGEIVDDQVDAFLVVGDVVLDDDFLLAPVIVQDRALDADSFQQAFGQDQLLVSMLISWNLIEELPLLMTRIFIVALFLP